MAQNYGIVLSQFGAADVLQFSSELPMPKMSSTQVVIENHFAGINPVDYKTRQGLGWAGEKYKLDLPTAILGFDMAGVVVQAGQNSGFQIGQKVCALSFEGGGYARYVAVEGVLLATIPDKVSFIQAAALPTAGITAYQLIQQAALQAGQKVLISAPVGGVGHLAMQLLKHKQQELGLLEIMVICSTEKVSMAQKLGATQLVDYKKTTQYPPLEADVFLDLVGGKMAVAALDAVKKGGRVICVPTIHVPLLQKEGAFKNLQVESIIAQPSGVVLQHLVNLISQQKLHVHIEKIYPIWAMSQAHQQLEQGRTQGKILVEL